MKKKPILCILAAAVAFLSGCGEDTVPELNKVFRKEYSETEVSSETTTTVLSDDDRSVYTT